MEFGFSSEKSRDKKKITVIDIRSFFHSLVKPLKVTTEDGKHFVLDGVTEKGNRGVAYVTPSRKEGAYTRVELYAKDAKKPFLVLDEIILNQPIPASRFVFPEDKLLASPLRTTQMPTGQMIQALLSMGKFFRAIMARLVLAGADDTELKSTVEKMCKRPLDWKKLKEQDKKATIILRSIFSDDAAPDSKTIQEGSTAP